MGGQGHRHRHSLQTTMTTSLLSYKERGNYLSATVYPNSEGRASLRADMAEVHLTTVPLAGLNTASTGSIHVEICRKSMSLLAQMTASTPLGIWIALAGVKKMNLLVRHQ